MLKAYFDKSNDEPKPSMTLSCVAATDSIWTELNGGWCEILGRHDPPVAFMHMYDAVHLQEPFSAGSGWTHEKVAGLINNLLSYLTIVAKDGYCQFTCTLDMDAYRRLQTETYQMESPAELLANTCLDEMIDWYFLQYKGFDLESQLFFDAGEPFEPIIRSKWEREAQHFKDTGIYNKWAHITHVGFAHYWITPGIQVADMLGWATTRESNDFVESYKHLALAMRSLLPSHFAKIDERQLRRRYRPLIYRP